MGMTRQIPICHGHSMDDWWDRREWHICMYMVEMVEMDEALEQKALLGAACQAGEGVWKSGPWMVDLLSCLLD